MANSVTKALPNWQQNSVNIVEKQEKKSKQWSSHPALKKNSDNLKDMRKKMGYTLYDVARLSGLSPSYLSRLESNERRFNTETLSRLALAFGCSESAFFSDADADANLEKNDLESSFKKDVPIYRVLPAGVDISDNQNPTILFSEILDYSFRPHFLFSSTKGFGIYAFSDAYYPRFSPGNLLFFDFAESYKMQDFVMVVDQNSSVFLGEVSFYDRYLVRIKELASNQLMDFKIADLHSLFKLVGAQFS